MAIDCTLNHLTTEQILAAFLTKDTNGNCGLRLIPVTAAEPDVDWMKSCNHANHTQADLLRLIAGVDGDGKIGLRVIFTETVDENCIDCNNNNIPLGDHIWSSIIGTADDNLPALRLAQPPVG